MAGCVRFEPKPIDLASAAVDFEARSLETPELRAFLEQNLGALPAWPLTEWRFESLALAAFFLHPSLDVARAELAAGHAAEITAGGRPNPTLGVTPEYVFNPESGVSPWIATLQIDIPIETAGKRGHRLTRAHHLSEAARWRLGETAWQVRSAVRAAWLDVIDAERRAELAARQLSGETQALAAIEKKLELGGATTDEAARWRLATARTRLEIAEARGRGEEARARLAASIGVPLPAITAIHLRDEEPPSDSALSSAEARRRALTSRADLLGALAEYAAAEAALRLEIARQYPDVHLGTGYQFDQGENQWALGLTAEIPVLNRNEGPIAEASARRAEIAARVRALQAQIIGSIDLALAGWRNARGRLALAAGLQDAQEERVRSARAQFEAGALEALDRLTAEAELAAAKRVRWDARIQAARAFGALEDAIQFPLSADLTQAPRPIFP